VTLRLIPTEEDLTCLDLESLKPYANPRRLQYIEAVLEHGGVRAAGRAIGVDHGAISRGIQKCRAEAAQAARQAAIAPRGTDGFVVREITTAYDADGEVDGEWVREGPEPVLGHGGELEGPARDGHDGWKIQGVSTYYGAGGEVRGQWVKTKADEAARLQGIEAALAKLAHNNAPRLAPLPAPAHSLRHLLNLYIFTDYHLGMRAWAEEGGADWDLQIAEELILKCFEHMVASAPAARVGFIAQLGDFLHFDGLLPLTPTSRHVVDAAAHYEAIVDAAIRIMQKLIDFALHRHDEVVVLGAEGNHDIAGSMWMRPVLRALYQNEPRVKVIRSASPFYAYEFGKNMLAFHHGHLKKKEQLPVLFADRYDEMWGRTKKRYAHTGHYHHEVVVKEESGMRVIQHPTLAPSDSHSSRSGFSLNGRQTVAITYHERFGKAWEQVVTPEMLEPLAA
jgi:hypothetical protein